MAEDTAQFTLVPRGGIVPFEATCFNDVATAEILTWKQFTQIEFQKRLEFEQAKWNERCQLDIANLQISLDESQTRFNEELAAKNTELEDLRQIIAKDRKKNIPAIIAGIAEPVLSSTDAAVVGNIAEFGTESLAAVGIVGTFLSALIWILGQTRSAISAIISQNLGAGKIEDLKSFPAQAIFFNIALSIYPWQ